jgi:hypothetical protein
MVRGVPKPIACVLLAACSAACGDRGAPPKPTPAPEIDPALAGPDDAMGRRLRDLAREHAREQVPTGTYFRDRLERGEHRDFLAILTANHCYRIVAASDPAVEDLDVIVFDPTGVQWRQDLDQGPNPVLGDDADLCPANSGAHRLQARMTSGSGEFLIGVYRSP